MNHLDPMALAPKTMARIEKGAFLTVAAGQALNLNAASSSRPP